MKGLKQDSYTPFFNIIVKVLFLSFLTKQLCTAYDHDSKHHDWAKCLPSIWEALGSIPSTVRKTETPVS
jgi:hypothetical protein